MIWHRQSHLQQCKHRAHKSLHATIGQVKHLLDRQHDFNGLVTIIKLAATVFLTCVPPGLFKIIRQPEGDRAALYQRFVVFGPVLDTV